MLKNLTASKINTFNNCSFQFKCSYIERRPQIRVDDTAALFGSAVHDIIVKYYDKIDDSTPSREISKKVDEVFVENSNWKTDVYKKRLKDIQRNLISFELDRIKKRWRKPVLLEKRLKAELFPDLLPFEGIVDAYFQDQKLIVDWKTGRYFQMETSLMIQGKIYEMLLLAHGYSVKLVNFNNLTLGRQLTLPKITDGWLEKEATRILEMIESGRFPKRESGLCGYCSYILSCHFSGVCPWGNV